MKMDRNNNLLQSLQKPAWPGMSVLHGGYEEHAYTTAMETLLALPPAWISTLFFCCLLHLLNGCII